MNSPFGIFNNANMTRNDALKTLTLSLLHFIAIECFWMDGMSCKFMIYS